MGCRKVVLVMAACALVVTRVGAQDSAQRAAQQAELRAAIEQIARDRPPHAEMAARDLMRQLSLAQASLDSLRMKSLGEYWGEVAQLTVQREMLLHQADSLRRKLMGQMFATEAQARALQRQYRDMTATAATPGPIIVINGVPVSGVIDGVPVKGDTIPSQQTRMIRQRLQELLGRHFAAEDSLRSLEIADIEHRLEQVRAETERRRRERAELVRREVDEILRQAVRPE